MRRTQLLGRERRNHRRQFGESEKDEFAVSLHEQPCQRSKSLVAGKRTYKERECPSWLQDTTHLSVDFWHIEPMSRLTCSSIQSAAYLTQETSTRQQ